LTKAGKAEAQRAINFVTGLKHVKDPWHGRPFELLPWEERIITDIYGTLKTDGTRKYRTVYIELPKKNGKTELMSALGLKQLCADDEWAAEVYGCAADKGQASLAFDVAVEMVDQNNKLRTLITPVLSRKRLVYKPRNSFYQVLSAESYTKHGLNVSACLFDELHAQPNRNLYDVMTFGSGDARRQPLYFIITTAGRDPERTSIGWEVHQKAEDILLGKRVDKTFYPVIFGYDPDNQRIWTGWGYEKWKGENPKKAWMDKKIWSMVNPSDGITIRKDAVKESYDSAKGNDSDETNFQQLRLNIWVKVKTSRWLPLDVWNKNAGLIVPDRLRGRKCYGGLDLSSKLDITAFVLLFPPDDENPTWDILPTFWIPEDNMWERVEKDGVPYDKWEKNGFIKTTPGNVIDYKFIEKDIIRQKDDYDIQEIGFDPWNATQTSIVLEDAGIHPEPVRQGYKDMSPAMKEIQALLTSGHVNHGNNPVLNWMFDNLEVKQDENDNVRPVKSKDRTKRIDGFVALVNAMNRALNAEDTSSVFDTREPRVL
jgi:phage terminase large subunit-like protein